MAGPLLITFFFFFFFKGGKGGREERSGIGGCHSIQTDAEVRLSGWNGTEPARVRFVRLARPKVTCFGFSGVTVTNRGACLGIRRSAPSRGPTVSGMFQWGDGRPAPSVRQVRGWEWSGFFD